VQDMGAMFRDTLSLSACNRHRIAAGWGDDLLATNYLLAPAGACASHCAAAGLCTAYPSCAAGFHGAVDGRMCIACPADRSCAGGANQPVVVADNDSILTAVAAWLADPTAAQATHGNISAWDVSGVTNMDGLLCTTSHCATAYGTNFPGAAAFSDNISAWDVSAVTSMRMMFAYASSFDAELSGWNVTAVRDMGYMFFHASSFDADLSGWNVAAVQDMGFMFYQAPAFNGDLSGWGVAAVTSMRYMFSGASAFNADLSGWDAAAVTSIDYMFLNSGLSDCNKYRIAERWEDDLEDTDRNNRLSGGCTDYCTSGLCPPDAVGSGLR